MRTVPWIVYILLKAAILTAINGLKHGVHRTIVVQCLESALQEAEEEIDDQR